MPLTIAFDVYGTLIDTAGIVTALERHLGRRALGFSQLWREKQLEYSFRRGLMQNYVDFSTCTLQALDYACRRYGVELTGEQRDALMDAYARLPAFDDVAEGLGALAGPGARLYAFSNGPAPAVDTVLSNAGIRRFFEDVVSVDELRSYKPSPAVYAHFLRRSGAAGSESWLISSNPFDVIGAVSAGLRAAWVKRTPDAVFDPWEIQPSGVVGGFEELPRLLGIS